MNLIQTYEKKSIECVIANAHARQGTRGGGEASSMDFLKRLGSLSSSHRAVVFDVGAKLLLLLLLVPWDASRMAPGASAMLAPSGSTQRRG